MEFFAALGINIWLITKILFLLAIGIYIIFALVIVRQVGLMTRTLKAGFEFPIQFVALVHLLFAIGTFVLAFLIL
jgi:hypothetical protein